MRRIVLFCLCGRSALALLSTSVRYLDQPFAKAKSAGRANSQFLSGTERIWDVAWEAKSRRRGLHMRIQVPRRYSNRDWWDNVINLPKSRLLEKIRGHLAFNTAWAAAVSLAHALTPSHVFDDLHVSTVPHTTMAGALSLLLVFRTNAAYDRFWEARKVWGSVTNTARNAARLSAVTMAGDEESVRLFCEYAKTFPYLLKQHLQNERVDEELWYSRLPAEEITHMQEHPNPPLFATLRMSQVLARSMANRATVTTTAATSAAAASVAAFAVGGAAVSNPHGHMVGEPAAALAAADGSSNDGDSGGGGSSGNFVVGSPAAALESAEAVWYRIELERQISSLVDYLGMCERILGTPVPRSYSRHTSRFLTFYCLTLPVVLVPHTELFTAPIVGAVCWGLMSIEEIAYTIEQPFVKELALLPLAQFCEKIRMDIERFPLTPQLALGPLPSGPAADPGLPAAAAAAAGFPVAASAAAGVGGGSATPSGGAEAAIVRPSGAAWAARIYPYLEHDPTRGVSGGGGMMERLMAPSPLSAAVVAPSAPGGSGIFDPAPDIYPRHAYDAGLAKRFSGGGTDGGKANTGDSIGDEAAAGAGWRGGGNRATGGSGGGVMERALAAATAAKAAAIAAKAALTPHSIPIEEEN